MVCRTALRDWPPGRDRWRAVIECPPCLGFFRRPRGGRDHFPVDAGSRRPDGIDSTDPAERSESLHLRRHGGSGRRRHRQRRQPDGAGLRALPRDHGGGDERRDRRARSRAGATEFVVRDSHGNKTNLLAGRRRPRARLLRGASTGPKNMMEGIDATFRRGDLHRLSRQGRHAERRFSRTRRTATSSTSRSTACRCRRPDTTRWSPASTTCRWCSSPATARSSSRRADCSGRSRPSREGRDRRRRDRGPLARRSAAADSRGRRTCSARSGAVQAVQADAAVHDGAQSEDGQAARRGRRAGARRRDGLQTRGPARSAERIQRHEVTPRSSFRAILPA